MKRILIKLSGEGLANKKENLLIDSKIVANIVVQIKKLMQQNIQIGIVIGGGNFWRGASAEKNGIKRNRADYIGMLATIMNGLAIQSSFESYNVNVYIQSAIKIDENVATNYVNEQSLKMLNKNFVVIFVGGTGRPFFTTDTAATLVASEIHADCILMAKNGVDGIYSQDPKINKDAKFIEKITFSELINKNLRIMDITAMSMAKENNIDLLVFNITKKDALIKVMNNDMKHTRVSNK